jgi:hypothetical protein
VKRYKYNGRGVFKFVQERTLDGETGELTKFNQFNVDGNYNLDPKANPNYRFRARLNFGTSGYNRRFKYNPVNRLENTMQSSIAYDRIFRNKPINFSISANHNQNTESHALNIGLPELAFGLTQINPFKRKTQIGKTRWYEKITTSYTFNARNYVSGIDTLLFRGDNTDEVVRNVFKNASYGARHTVPVSTNLKVLKHFTVTPSVNYTQWFYGRTTRRTWNADSARVESDTINEFATAYQYNGIVSAERPARFRNLKCRPDKRRLSSRREIAAPFFRPLL